MYGATTSSTPFLLSLLWHFAPFRVGVGWINLVCFALALTWRRLFFIPPAQRNEKAKQKKKLWMGASHVFPYSEFGMLCSIRILVSLVSWQCSSYAFVTSRRRLLLFPFLPWGHLGIGATFESPHLAFLSQFRLRQKKEEGGSASIFSFSPWKGNRQISTFGSLL